ncbi:MAG: septal ring lytic transglycosylase RlpA family protein [Ignavibacteria bacterium]|nr:septal ring lytic transglycosylase RlpA family protein [Ignavibacteria bacterium]
MHNILIALFIFTSAVLSAQDRYSALHDDEETVQDSSKTVIKAESLTIPLKGKASYYGSEFNGRKTANGEIYDETAMTAAHRTLPFGTVLRVTNIRNGLSVIVRINDRGPFHPDRILDLSKAAAEELDLIKYGVTEIESEIVD